jgi:cytoskeletal protein CcmA (bactofilin family)
MFSKSPILGRNESTTPPETKRAIPSPASAEIKPAMIDPEVAVGKSFPAPRVPPPLTVGQTLARPLAQAAVVATSASASTAGKTASANDPVVGAHLIVGPEVKLKGAEILNCDTLVVEGRVEATMDSRIIRIAENGAFIGKVSIDTAEIHGTLEGDLTARSQLVIHSTGKVHGTVRYGRLIAEDGCELGGHVAPLAANVVPDTGTEVAAFPKAV